MQVIEAALNYLSVDFKQPKAVAIFCKVVTAAMLAKLLILWPMATLAMRYQSLSVPSSFIGKVIFGVSVLSNEYLQVVLIAFVLALVMLLIIPWNYLSGIVFFYMVINFFRIIKPMINGGDIMLVMLSCWMILMANYPSWRSARLQQLQILIFNTGVILCQLQIAAVYFLSGWDKLVSETWQSGQAMIYITHLRHMLNPMFIPMLKVNSVNVVLAWATIILELSFAFFVWPRRTRLTMLLFGTAFHLIIAIMFSLPDFGLMMIISYLIFLRDSDYQWISQHVLKQKVHRPA